MNGVIATEEQRKKKSVLTCNIMGGSRKVASFALTGLSLTFQLEREPIQQEVRYNAAHSSATRTDQMFAQAAQETAVCK